MIPAKAVQAAHAAICEQSLEDCLDPDWRGKCVKAVEAAAPHLQAPVPQRVTCPPRVKGDKPHCPDCSGIVGETGVVW